MEDIGHKPYPQGPLSLVLFLYVFFPILYEEGQHGKEEPNYKWPSDGQDARIPEQRQH